MMLHGGDNGPAIVKGAAAQSMLFERIADRSMPPESELPLTEAKIELIHRWIETGAAALDDADVPDRFRSASD